MAKAYRANRNSGPDQMTDKEYRHLVRMTLDSQKHFVYTLKTGCRRYDGTTHYYSKRWKHDTWLHLMGLMETWEMAHD